MATIKTGIRTRSINAVFRSDKFGTEEGTIACCAMDLHADTCVAGPNLKILVLRESNVMSRHIQMTMNRS
jgi:hypothetical protein